MAAEAPDSLIDSLMGHKTYKPKYGKGPSLELKLKYLQQIAFKAAGVGIGQQRLRARALVSSFFLSSASSASNFSYIGTCTSPSSSIK